MKDLVQYVFEKRGIELPYNDIKLDDVVATFIYVRGDFFKEDNSKWLEKDATEVFKNYKPVAFRSPWLHVQRSTGEDKSFTSWQRQWRFGLDSRQARSRYMHMGEVADYIALYPPSSYEFEGFYLAREKREKDYKLYAIVNDKYEKRIKKEEKINKLKVIDDPAYGFKYLLVKEIDKNNIDKKTLLEMKDKYNINGVYPYPADGSCREFNKGYENQFVEYVMDLTDKFESFYGNDFKGCRIIMEDNESENCKLVWYIEGEGAKKAAEFRRKLSDHIASYYDGNHYNGD